MIESRTWCGPALAALLVTGVARATTWTVDDDGPADFSDIPAALAVAGPGDTLLVAAGTYSAFTLTTPLTMVGYDAMVSGEIALSGVVGGRVTLSGFSAEALSVTGCPGRVLLDELAIQGPLGVSNAYAWIADSGDVRLHRCTIGNVDQLGGGYLAGLIVSSTRLEITGSTIAGDNGFDGGFCEDGDTGSFGILCNDGADVHLSGSTVLGGDGGDAGPSCLFFPVGGDGGVGIFLSTGSSLLVTGTAGDVVEGGAAGYGDNFPDDGLAAPGLVLGYMSGSEARVSGASFVGGLQTNGLLAPGIQNSGGTLDEVTPEDASLELIGTPVAGSTVTFVVRGPVGANARIRLGRAPRVIELATTFEDRLLAPLRLIALGGIPASGEVTLSFTLGAAWPAGALIMAQASCTTGAGTTLSQSVPVIVR